MGPPHVILPSWQRKFRSTIPPTEAMPRRAVPGVTRLCSLSIWAPKATSKSRVSLFPTVCLDFSTSLEHTLTRSQGAIIFACHKVDSYPRDPQANGHPVGYASHYLPHSQPIYDPNNHYELPPVSGGPPYNYVQMGSGPHPAGAFHPNQQWPEGANGQYGHEWPSSSVAPSTSNVRSGMYPSDHPNQHTWSSQPPSYNLDPSHPSHPRSITPYNNYSQAGGEGHGSDGGSASDVPPPRSGQRRGSARDQYGTGGRSTGKPPVGIQKCSSCKVTQSPEWRKGPSGKKDLCNA